MYNFYFILKFHKNLTHGDGENLHNSIRAVRNIVRSVSCGTITLSRPWNRPLGGRFLPYRNRLLPPLRPIFIGDTQDFLLETQNFCFKSPIFLGDLKIFIKDPKETDHYCTVGFYKTESEHYLLKVGFEGESMFQNSNCH